MKMDAWCICTSKFGTHANFIRMQMTVFLYVQPSSQTGKVSVVEKKKYLKKKILREIGGGLEEAKDGILRGEAISYKELETGRDFIEGWKTLL